MAIFRLPMRTEPWEAGHRLDCPVCGKNWFPWAGSYLPCHATCLFYPQAEADIFECRDATKKIAERLGVSDSIVRGAIVRESKRRGAAKREQRA